MLIFNSDPGLGNKTDVAKAGFSGFFIYKLPSLLRMHSVEEHTDQDVCIYIYMRIYFGGT